MLVYRAMDRLQVHKIHEDKKLCFGPIVFDFDTIIQYLKIILFPVDQPGVFLCVFFNFTGNDLYILSEKKKIQEKKKIPGRPGDL